MIWTEFFFMSTSKKDSKKIVFYLYNNVIVIINRERGTMIRSWRGGLKRDEGLVQLLVIFELAECNCVFSSVIVATRRNRRRMTTASLTTHLICTLSRLRTVCWLYCPSFSSPKKWELVFPKSEIFNKSEIYNKSWNQRIFWGVKSASEPAMG